MFWTGENSSSLLEFRLSACTNQNIRELGLRKRLHWRPVILGRTPQWKMDVNVFNLPLQSLLACSRIQYSEERGHVAASRKRCHQWCLTLTPNNTETIERMTCDQSVETLRAAPTPWLEESRSRTAARKPRGSFGETEQLFSITHSITPGLGPMFDQLWLFNTSTLSSII